jgi:hypothetical protein
MRENSKTTKIFYGYWVALMGFMGMYFFGGFGVYGFSLFVKPLEIEYGWQRGPIMLALGRPN